MDEKIIANIACHIYEGAQPDAGDDWALEDATTFTVEHLIMGDFDWSMAGPGGRGTPKPKFSYKDMDAIEPIVKKALKRYY